uniref:Uncharacterized protein n=1 Tax=Nitzschia sp. PL1-4 TaxID=2083272 RepID=A0A2Z5ZAX5_9STRA|nr:hypothetical protein [Nitzschia sp. PL1-4]
MFKRKRLVHYLESIKGNIVTLINNILKILKKFFELTKQSFLEFFTDIYSSVSYSFKKLFDKVFKEIPKKVYTDLITDINKFKKEILDNISKIKKEL